LQACQYAFMERSSSGVRGWFTVFLYLTHI
jgi:hypothetical protein